MGHDPATRPRIRSGSGLRPADRLADSAGRQVDLPPGGDHRRDRRRSDPGHQLPRFRRHPLDPERGRQPRRDGQPRAAGFHAGRVHDRRGRARGPPQSRPDRRRQRRHADEAAAGVDRRLRRRALADERRRFDPQASGRPDRRPAATDGSGDRGDRRPLPADPYRRPRPARHRVRTAGGQCPGQVLPADRRAEGRRSDHGDRAARNPRPHRGDARRGRGQDRARTRPGHGVAEPEPEPGRGRCPGRHLFGRLLHGRRLDRPWI